MNLIVLGVISRYLLIFCVVLQTNYLKVARVFVDDDLSCNHKRIGISSHILFETFYI